MSCIFMRFPKGRSKALTLSYDDGVEQDIRLIDIMNQYGLKGTFNLNSGIYSREGTVFPEGTIHRRLTKKQAYEVYADCGQEIAVHSFTHPFLEQLPANLCLQEIVKDRGTLENLFDRIIRGMAYPYGTYNDQVIQALQCAGIVYARTTISTGDFLIPQDWLRLEATCHHKDERLEALTERFVNEKPLGAPWLFYLWGHSYEFEADGNWDLIEKFAASAGGREDVWYASNIEIYDYIDAYKRLVFSMDASMVFNPSAVSLWFATEERGFVINGGESLAIRESSK